MGRICCVRSRGLCFEGTVDKALLEEVERGLGSAVDEYYFGGGAGGDWAVGVERLAVEIRRVMQRVSTSSFDLGKECRYTQG